jgi:hypothetical protein
MGHVPERSADIGLSYFVQGKARLLQGDTATARQLVEKASQAMRAGFGPAHPATREVVMFQQQLTAR